MPPPRRKRTAALTAELGSFIGGAADCCAVSWDGSDRPLLVAAAGSAQAVLGAAAAELVGRPAGQLFLGGERAARDLAALCESGPASETRQMLRNGAQFTASLLLRRAPDGGVVALVRDLAAGRAEADAALRTEDLGRFASLVAHEVRNPLSAVKIALQTLERHGTLGPNDLRRVSIATREVGNIELLLNEVLEFARPPSLSLVPVDPRGPVREAVEGVMAEFASRGVHFELSLPERMALVNADPTRLHTAVQILCRQAAMVSEEAAAALAPTGQADLSPTAAAARVEVVLRELPGARWELGVLDAGILLSTEQREKAFAPFTPSRARGSGLGLAVCARIAGEHGGGARMEARSGGGNAVYLTFGS